MSAVAPQRWRGNNMACIVIHGFEFEFDAANRLRQLRLPGGAPLLHESDQIADLGNQRHYSARGWDECFPTIEPFDASPVMGDLIWQPASVRHDADEVVQSWSTPRFNVSRTFSTATGDALSIYFEATNVSSGSIQVLWASHAVFAVDHVASIALPDGQVLHDFTPNNTSAKFFVRNTAAVVVTRRDTSFTLATDQPWWGVWVNRGNWPASQPLGEFFVGIEPTNAASEIPEGSTLEPGASFRGTVTVTLQKTGLPRVHARTLPTDRR